MRGHSVRYGRTNQAAISSTAGCGHDSRSRRVIDLIVGIIHFANQAADVPTRAGHRNTRAAAAEHLRAAIHETDEATDPGVAAYGCINQIQVHDGSASEVLKKPDV